MAYATAQIDLQQADQATLAHPEAFLRWLSTALTLKLGLDLPSPHELNSLIGSQLSTTLFVREQVLTTLDRPLVLIIKHLDRVLGYANTAQVMLPLLRSWHEEARHDPVWRNLRLVVSYSTDAYLLLNINFSPFNVGLPLLPPPFTTEQVQALAAIYGLAWRGDEGDRLMQLTGGNPCLVHLAVYHLSQGQSTFDDLMQTASAQGGLYQSQLQRLLAFVQERPAVIAPLKALVMNPDPIPVEPLLAYQLEGVGLIRAVANGWQISCDLYRQYFYKTWLDP